MTVFLHILDTGPPAANFFHPETVSLDLFSVPHELKKAWVGASPEDAGAWPETLCLQWPGFSLNLGRKVRLPTSLLFLQPALSTGECSASEPGDFQNTKDQLLQVVQNAASSLRNREWEGQTVLQKPVSRGFRPLWHRQAEALGTWVELGTRESWLSQGNRPALVMQAPKSSWLKASAYFSSSSILAQSFLKDALGGCSQCC